MTQLSDEVKENVVNRFGDQVCKKCKQKIIARTKRIRPFDLLRPNKLSAQFSKIVCKDCKNKIKGGLENEAIK